ESNIQQYKTTVEKSQIANQRRSKRRLKEKEIIGAYRHQVYRLLKLVLSFLESKCVSASVHPDVLELRTYEATGKDGVLIPCSSILGEKSKGNTNESLNKQFQTVQTLNTV